jgi:hypothetical protein
MQRPVVAQVARGMEAVEPMVIFADRHVRERVDMRARVDGRHHQIAVEAVADAVGFAGVERARIAGGDDPER